mmetsp:Transcript_9722/g.23150  ORF Transcript_9722/g.23150 Transcript_9722/m.23150 type:complete len:265 (+) Transcript_9722:52-846(+)
MPLKKDVADKLSGKWQVDLFKSPCADPMTFLYGCCCPNCKAYEQRNELLDMTGEPYVCCAGLFACGPLGQPQDRSCLCVEAYCCPWIAISANRFMIQTRFDRENTFCDDFIITFTVVLSWVICIARMVSPDVPEELENLVDLLIAVVQGCMLTQQHVEIKHIKSLNQPYTGPAIACGAPMASAPNQQNMQSYPGGGGGMGGGMGGGNTQTMAVTVPPGAGPGTVLAVQHPNTGAHMQVTVPAGVGPGQTFQVPIQQVVNAQVVG